MSAESRRRRYLIYGHGGKNVTTDGWVGGEPTSPGNVALRLFGTDRPPQLPLTGLDLTGQLIVPPMSGVRVAIVVFGPTKDQPTAGAAAVPAELAGMMDAEGTHRTDTVDVGVVISGSILLRVPGQPDVRLRQGDTFVQAGAAHSWRNDGEEPCEVVITMIGAHGERADGT